MYIKKTYICIANSKGRPLIFLVGLGTSSFQVVPRYFGKPARNTLETSLRKNTTPFLLLRPQKLKIRPHFCFYGLKSFCY